MNSAYLYSQIMLMSRSTDFQIYRAKYSNTNVLKRIAPSSEFTINITSLFGTAALHNLINDTNDDDY